ncbi:putative membrane protein [Campylobacter blaseri]|uniref:Uncharacterized protein n=1 Tax=Campylobacter blaseri TaxID=2042961 RepID=A0A2P8R409_9BACT|nr:hypothetical protein [Campylobacter blaseri]PSM53215.1 hypothetical protein CQ405_01320 [Campylobacter blaseri]PSM54681.1 hypothetical protein CRN67_01320 [Campylobacter blaseri]QKF86840.1 putative membrane protein [Campylobacter blaseri]
MNEQEIKFEIYKRIYQSRDLELQFFWQRAVFLSAFLFIAYTAYGTFQMKLFFISSNQISYLGTDITNLISIFICFCGYVLSIFWVLMFKGSKNSYEAYEKMLDDFVEAQMIFNNKCNSSKNIKKEFFLPANLDLNNSKDNFFSLKEYRYSLSKINISLGYFSMFIFFVLSIFHLLAIPKFIKNILNFINNIFYNCDIFKCTAFVCIVIFIGFLCYLPFIISRNFRQKK